MSLGSVFEVDTVQPWSLGKLLFLKLYLPVAVLTGGFQSKCELQQTLQYPFQALPTLVSAINPLFTILI